MSKTPRADRSDLTQNPLVQLVISVIFDIIGCLSYFADVAMFAGELTDILWAPIQAGWVLTMMGSKGAGLAAFSLAEELLPFTDIVPSCSIAWFCKWILGWR